MSLSAGKKTVQGSGKGLISVGAKAAAQIFQGGLAMLSSGYAMAAAAPAGTDAQKMAAVSLYRLAGVSMATVVGGGADGAVPVDVQAGDWLCKNSAGADAITVAQVGHHCFIVDDETVARTSNGQTRPRAGVVVAVDATGVMVRISPEIAAGADRFLLLQFAISEADTLAGTSAEFVAPLSGSIMRLNTTVQKAVTTGGTVSALVGTTAVAGLGVVVANGAAKGTTGTGTPTLGDATTLVAAGQRVQIVTTGFAVAGAVSGNLVIAY